MFFVVLLTQLSSGISLDLIIFAWPMLAVTFIFLLCLAYSFCHLLFFFRFLFAEFLSAFIFNDDCGRFLLLSFATFF